MRLDRRPPAVKCFMDSVKLKPYNWSAWSQMAQLVSSADMVGSLGKVAKGAAHYVAVYFTERGVALDTNAHFLRYQLHARPSHCHKPGHEHDQGVIGDLPFQRTSQSTACIGVLPYAR